MSVNAFPTFNNTGVRNLSLRSGLGGVPCLGAVDPDTVSQLVDNAWNPQSVQNLIDLGATDGQLLSLPFPASESEMRAAYAQLYSQLLASPSTPTAQNAKAQQSLLIQQQQLDKVAKALNTNPWTNGVVPYGASGGGAVDAVSWLAGNSGTILLVLAAIVIVPPLIKKI